MLTPDELLVIDYLKPLGKQFVSAKEVCRRAVDRQRYSEEPDWAKPVMKRMEKKGILEMNAFGHYRIKPPDDTKKGRQIPLDPRIQQILHQSGKDFSTSFILEDDGSYQKVSSAESPAKPPQKKKKS